MKYYSEVNIDKDGNIYLLYNIETIENAIFKFVPDTLEFDYIYNPLGDYYRSPAVSTFLTDSGQLWASDLGWRDADGIWHLTVRSPIFTGNRSPENGNMYLMYQADPLYESSNGYIWFVSGNGLAFLDQKQEKWCWVTTDQAYVIEDGDRTLWTIAYGKLYKLDMR